ncbi:zinc-ribbon domain containing protein [Virgibacillus profundi]|nr:zinc-ribbon domain containing protein [Virgibacillus profundi]
MSYENVKLWFARDEAKNIITINEVDKKNKHNTYNCPICGSDLKPKAIESKRITPHFAHVDASKCSSETMIHWWFKHRFLESGDTFTVIADKEREYVCKNVSVEQPHDVEDGVYRPDMTIETECGETIYFEMNYSNQKKVKDYLDMWLELKNIVVEVDVKSLMKQDEIPKFKALFYNGKCFNTKRNDTYYNTIGKYKEELMSSGVRRNAKERVKKLDWFWEDVFRYKKGEVDIEHLTLVIDVIDGEEKDLVYHILNKQSCANVYKDYLNYKQEVVFNELLREYNSEKSGYYAEKSGFVNSWATKYWTKKIEIRNESGFYKGYDILKYTANEINDSVRNIIIEIKKKEQIQKDIAISKNNSVLLNAINYIEEKYKQIDKRYNLRLNFQTMRADFCYGSRTIIGIEIPKEIAHSNDYFSIIEYLDDKKIDGYVNNVDKFDNINELEGILQEMDIMCRKIKFIDIYEEKAKTGRKRRKRVIKSRNVNYSLECKYYSESLIEIRIHKLIDNYYRLSLIRPILYIHKDNLYFGRTVIGENNILDREKIKEIDDYESELMSTILSLIQHDLNIMCKECNKNILLKAGEIKFYLNKGFNLPKRCKSCRKKRKQKQNR